jgi:hypothetical protein
MPTLDIPISPDLQKLFDLPACDLISLPPAEPLRVRLPNGGELKAFSDISKGIPSDCSLSINLMLQLSPILANMKCLLSVVGLIKPVNDLLDAIKTVNPLQIGSAVGELLPALKKFTDACITPFLPLLPLAQFLIDILNLILRMLKCMIGQLKTVLEMMQGITLRINDAQAAGNKELAQILECARKNAARSAEHTTKSMEPVSSVVDLMSPLLGLFGQSLTIPGPGSTDDVEAMRKTIQDLEDVVTNIQAVVDVLEQIS